MPTYEAAKKAAKEKFRAVLLSSFTASLGFLPAALSHGVGTQIQKPLAVVVLGGMLITGLLILLLIPPILKYVNIEGY
jgi:Putative silver efflux pump